MDTKLKNFSRSFLTKAVAFVLALVFLAAAVLNFSSLFFLTLENSEAESVLESVVSFTDYSPLSGAYFQNELVEYCSAVIKSKLLFGSGSREDWESYQEARLRANREDLQDKKDAILKRIKKESGTTSFANLARYINNRKVELRFIAEHEHYIDEWVTIGYYGDNSEYAFDADTGDEYSDYWEYYVNNHSFDPYDSDPEDTDEDVSVTAYNSQIYTGDREDSDESVTATTHKSQIYTGDRLGSKNAIPQSVKDKADNADNVIELCSCCFGDDPNIYDGYYEVVTNDNMILSEDYNNSTFDDGLETYESFKKVAKTYAEKIEAYSHASVIITDEKTNRILFSSFVDKKSGSITADEAIDLIEENYPFGFVYSSSEGEPLYCKNGANRLLRNATVRSCEKLYNVVYGFGEVNIIFGVDGYMVVADQNSAEPFDVAYRGSKEIEEKVMSYLVKTLVLLLAFLVLAVYLIVVAGKKPGDDDVHMAFGDGIFTLLRTAIDAGAIVCLVLLVYICYSKVADNILNVTSGAVYAVTGVGFLYYAAIAACSVVAGAFLLDWLTYVSRHAKNRSLLKNLFLPRVFGAMKKRTKKAFANEEKIAKDILNDVLMKLALFVLLPNIVIGIPCVYGSRYSFFAIFVGLLLALYDVGVLCYAAYYAANVRKIFDAVTKIRNGVYDIKINTSAMPRALKCVADDTVHVAEGLSAAIENAVRDERMKTELITNVSHDLKTPLTSIINYTDLLSRCNIEDSTAQGYIQVLKEKSERLKKLIEDLVEASKASSGAMKVELITVSLTELVSQIAGEFEDELAARGLEIIIDGEEKEILAVADGKLCHRVLDNLMSNVKKYAMPNTRVYITLSSERDFSTVTIKNISEGKLNITPQELKERFVRGDSSRTAEGNGLGLSIANDLCVLQGGSLELEIIGDLFSAKVSFAAATQNAQYFEQNYFQPEQRQFGE